MQLDWTTIATLAGVISLWTAVFIAVLKLMLDRERTHVDARFAQLEELIRGTGDRVSGLEKDLLTLRAELPRDYVRREDWIRFGITIHRKLDGFWEAIDDLKDRIYVDRSA